MMISKIENVKDRTLNDFSNMLKKSSLFAKKHNIKVSGDGEGCDIYVIPADYLQNFSATLDENFDRLMDAAVKEKYTATNNDFYFPCGGLSYDK